MATLSVDKYISFPKEHLKEYLELEYSVEVQPFALDLWSIDPVAKTFIIRESSNLVDGQVVIQNFEMTYLELIENFLSSYDPNVTVDDIKSIGQNSVASSITVGY